MGDVNEEMRLVENLNYICDDVFGEDSQYIRFMLSTNGWISSVDFNPMCLWNSEFRAQVTDEDGNAEVVPMHKEVKMNLDSLISDLKKLRKAMKDGWSTKYV